MKNKLALLAAVLLPVSLQAVTWSNNGTNMNSAGSWSAALATGGNADFGVPAGTQPNLSSSLSLFVTRFTATNSSGYVMTANPGQSLTLTANGTNGISSSATSGYNILDLPLILGAAASSTQTISVASGGDLVITGPISSANSNITLDKANSGTLFLLGQNSYTGPTRFNSLGGTIVINSIGNVNGGNSSLGAPTSIPNGTIAITNIGGAPAAALRYIGGTASTDRVIDYGGASSNANSFTLDASGSGALTWNGNLTVSENGTVGKNIWLNGVNSANNTFAGSIQNQAIGTGTTEVVKNGTGTWVLSGANTFTGGLVVNGGQLVLDYNTNSTVVNSANTLTFGNPAATAGLASIPSSGGTLKLVGKTSGTTSQTLGNATFLSGQARIVIDPNGGGGTTLTLGNTWSRNAAQGLLYLELPTGATLTSSPTLTNGLIGAAGTAGYAVVNDGTGVGFATVTGGNVVRFTGATTLNATNSTASTGATNFKSSGNLTLAAGPDALNTLDIDTSGGGTLNLNTTTATVSGLLFTGTGDYTISNGIIGRTDPTGVNVTHLQQFSTGLVSISALNSGVNATLLIAKGGPGTVAITTRGGNGTMKIFEGAIRADGATVISAGAIELSTGGVLELGAAGNFTGALGTAAGNVQFTGDGGFSAHGGTKTVQIGGNTNTIAWGATNFVPNANALVLSNVKSDSTIDFQNGLGLGNQQRVVRVNNGTATVDAMLSGTLSGSYGGGLIKEGAGTLSVTGNNSYIGETWVNAGTLLVNNTNGSGTGSGAVNVFAGATLGGNGTISGLVSVSGSLAPGNSIDTLNTGSLSLTATGVLDTELGRSGLTPVSDRTNVTGTVSLTSGADLKLTLFTGLTNPAVNDIFFLISNDGADDITGVFTKLNGANTTLTEGSLFNWNSQQWQITYQADFGNSGFTGGNDLALQVVPEPATWALLAGSLTVILVLRRRRVAS